MAIFYKSALRQGIVMGLCFCLYTTLMWLTHLDSTYLSIGQYFDIAIIILPIAIILNAIKKERDLHPVTIFQRFAIAIFIGAVSYLIYDPFLYVYHHYINPDWFASVLHLKEMELKASGVSGEKTIVILQKMKTSDIAKAGLFRWSAAIPSVLILPSLIALLSLIFIRKKKLE